MSLSARGQEAKNMAKWELLVIKVFKKNMEGRKVFTDNQQEENRTQAGKFHEDVVYLMAIE